MLMILKLLLLCSLSIVLIATSFLYFHEIYVEKKLKPLSYDQNIIKNVSYNVSNPQTLNLLTFNVWGLPVWLPRIDKVKRYNLIPDSILNINADVVCLQEAFDPKIRLRLLEKMTKAGYLFIGKYDCNTTTFLFVVKDCFGGLMTFSKYPILWERFYPHQIQLKMKQDEKKGRKGFLVSNIQTPYGEILVVNIHLYSGREDLDEEIRLNQVKYLEKILDSLAVNKKQIIIQGDLNVIHPFVIANKINKEEYHKSSAYDYLIKDMSFIDTKANIKEEDLSYDGVNNPYAATFYNSFEKRQKFDYCLYRFPNNNVKESTARTVFKTPFQISDHYGVFSQIGLE